jgi:hypothetical protein
MPATPSGKITAVTLELNTPGLALAIAGRT